LRGDITGTGPMSIRGTMHGRAPATSVIAWGLGETVISTYC
jgi:hypothetical protein